MMKTLNLIAMVILSLLNIAAEIAHADIAATLSPADLQNGKEFPYRSASLKIQNGTSVEFSAVHLQDSQGGPTFVYPAVILPKDTTTITVNLPAMSLSQIYNLTLSRAGDSTGKTVTSTAELNWPADLLTTGEFINPSVYEKLGQSLPTWPGELKLKIFLTMAGGVILLIGVMLLHRPILKTVLVLTVLLVITVILAYMLSPKRLSIVQVENNGDFEIITTRRTCEIGWGSPPNTASGDIEIISPTAEIIPIYQAVWQMREDEMTIQPGRFAKLKIRPDEVRIFGWKQSAKE